MPWHKFTQPERSKETNCMHEHASLFFKQAEVHYIYTYIYISQNNIKDFIPMVFG